MESIIVQYVPNLKVLYRFPTSVDMRNKWLVILRSKCSSVDWLRSKVCSKHFENKCFDHQRKLKESAIPTLFPGSSSTGAIKKVTRVSISMIYPIVYWVFSDAGNMQGIV